jgi:hypothetical protein
LDGAGETLYGFGFFEILQPKADEPQAQNFGL